MELFLCEGMSAKSNITSAGISTRLISLARQYFIERNTNVRKKLYKKLIRVARANGYISDNKFFELRPYKLRSIF